VVVGATVVVVAAVVVGAAVVVVTAVVVGSSVISEATAPSVPLPLVSAVEQPTSATKPKTMPQPMRAVRRSAGATESDDTGGVQPTPGIAGYFSPSFHNFVVKTTAIRHGAEQG
jgi:hypothetical protein